MTMKEMRMKKENEAKEGEGMNVIMKKWCSHTVKPELFQFAQCTTQYAMSQINLQANLAYENSLKIAASK